LLAVGSSSGPRLPRELTGPHRQAQEPTAATRAPTTPSPVLFRSGEASIDRGIAFQVHSLLAQEAEHATAPPRREAILAAYHAHLAGRVRYYGPLTPVDLRI
jgi:hypothetical protein